MLFYTPEFLAFSLILLAALGAVHKNEPRKLVLLIASYIFYMWWNPVFILLIIYSTTVDYIVGGRLANEDSPTRRRLLVTISIVANLGMLGIFKYFGFFTDSLLGIMRMLGYEPSWVSVNITLPVGISFYTFQTLSYTIDLYRRKISAARSPLDFALFVAFFPQLVAGPIVRASVFLPQLQKPIKISWHQRSFFLILRGMAKKVLIADNLAVFVDPVMASPAAWPSTILWLAAIAFSIQIYCDFSGYSDIAIGIARILGFRLPLNFDHPYVARNPAELWQRWHISMSSWFRDYVYRSFGRPRSRFIMYRNLVLMMTLVGLWHGASWNFVLWGLAHGVYIVVHRLYSTVYSSYRRKMNPDYKPSDNAAYYWLSVLLLQYSWLVVFPLFRITDPDATLIAFKKTVFFDFDFSFSGIGLGSLSFFSTLLLMAIFTCLTCFSYRVGHIDRYLAQVSTAKALAVCFTAGFVFFLMWPLAEAPFIYFQF